jgi:hypothetical protein
MSLGDGMLAIDPENPVTWMPKDSDAAGNFLRGIEDVYATEGPGVAGTGILTQGTNIPTGSGKFDVAGLIKSLLGTNKEGNINWLKLLPLLTAYMGSKDKAPPTGGGIGYAYAGPASQLQRAVVPHPAIPGARVAMHREVPVGAAQGGIMQAYAQGGPVPIRTGNQMMEDGGFVMTKRAVDGAGGPQGIRRLLPQAQLFQGPGDGSGRDDRIKTGIRAADGGITPALVSKNEMYVPYRDVQDAGGPRRVHGLMKSLERRA